MGKLFNDEDKFNPEIARASIGSGTAVAVLKGFIGLESAFNPKAYRYEPALKPPDASYGLAQILACTARGVGYTGIPTGLFDPFTSALYGGKFIRALAKKYPNLPDLIAAYNMGYPRKITATTQFIANIYKYPIQYRESPPADWIYANEPYVRRVSAYIAYYQAREKNDNTIAEQILTLIQKKDLASVIALFKPLIAEIKWDTKGNCPTCGKPL
jgi:soluble lytic murein transglycosylase-like protein